MEYIDIERDNRTFELRDFIRLVRTYWRAITAITLVCTLLALGWTMLQPKFYSSTATGLVIATGERDLISALSGDSLAQSKAVSYETLATSRPVAETVIEQLALDTTPDALLPHVMAEVPLDTTEIQITTEAESPTAAADLANAWVTALAEQVQLVEVTGDDPDAVGGVALQPLSNASMPQGPSSPILKLNLVIGALAGLGLGLLYVFARYKMDRRIRSVEEIQESFGVPVLGIIPTDEQLTDHREIIETGFSGGRGDHAYSEALRKLRTNLSFVSVDSPPRIVVVTSSLPGEGKSSITANLAVAIASAGRNVVVVDGDLRRPVVTELFGLVPGVGVTDVLTGQVDVEDVLQTYDRFPNLQVLGAGRGAPNPTELLASKAMHRMLETLAQDAFVLVDAPPLLPVTDAALLTASADGALIVATAQGTTTDELGEALGNLRAVHGNVLGVVLNRVPTSGADAGYYGKTSYAGSAEQPTSSAIASQLDAGHSHNQLGTHQEEEHAKARSADGDAPALQSKKQKTSKDRNFEQFNAWDASDSRSGSSSTRG